MAKQVQVVKEVVPVEKVVDIICNKCGNSLALKGAEDRQYGGLEEITVHGGYWSKHLEDMMSYTFSICECCLSDMFEGFKILPKKIDHLNGWRDQWKD